ncbi:MAG: hypothetical protein JXR30_01370 [Alphaproteobacteria bacterium]|nr:hypothetical protein [Alphaproteobacteria bacterium]
MTEKPHYHGHRKRLLEKFLSHPDSLQNYELIELLLTFVYPRRDTKPLAKEIETEVGMRDLFELEKLSKTTLSIRAQAL